MVGNYRLTPQAAADMDQIATYTRREHGERQCVLYIDELQAGFRRLGGFPGMGRHCGSVRPRLRSWKQGRHVIFYLPEAAGVLIVRVLHESMAHEEYDFSGDDV